ncbi:MAG: glycosyltransferase, partial [Neisseriaceae bacterium]
GRMLDPSVLIHDFSDSAALLDQLDLLISVDSAPVHLAGALGKPVWTLLPHVPDWRWLLDRDDSPWYGSVRLFRQPALQDWGTVVNRLQQALRQWLLL